VLFFVYVQLIDKDANAHDNQKTPRAHQVNDGAHDRRSRYSVTIAALTAACGLSTGG
jgi:hypothetical protein